MHLITFKFYNFFYFFVAPSALRTKLLLTTLRVANNEAPENYSPATRATNASSTEKPTIIRSATGKYN